MIKRMTVRSALIGCLLLILAACSGAHAERDEDLAEAINDLTSQPDNKKIDLSALTDFEWDQAFLLPPYTDEKTAEEQTGVPFKDKSNIAIRDDIYVLLFLHDGRAVRYVELNRFGANFLVEEGEYATPEHPVLQIVR